MENKVCAVVAEFNPLHNGHIYQINEIKKNKPKLIIAVISGNFVQRGEFSILSKFEKVQLALENGIDLVVELPIYYSLQNADIFSEYATKILEKLKVDYQVFGIEDDNLDNIMEIIKFQESVEYINKLKKYQSLGNSYIKSHELSLKDFNLLDSYKSNNILAISYIKSILKNNMNMKYIAIKRKSVGYNEKITKDNIASATFIRENVNKELIEKYIPSNTFNSLKKNKLNLDSLNDKLFNLFKYIFNVKSKIEIIKVYDFDVNIYNRISKIILKSTDYNNFIKLIKSRNYSINRIKRLMFNLILDIKKENINSGYDIEYIRVLGLNEKGAKYLKENNFENVFVNWKDIEKEKFNKIKIEKNAFILYDIFTGIKENLNPIYRR